MGINDAAELELEIQRALEDLGAIQEMLDDGANEDRVSDRLRRWRDRVVPSVSASLPADEATVWEQRIEQSSGVAFWDTYRDTLAAEIEVHRAFLEGAVDDLEQLLAGGANGVSPSIQERAEDAIEQVRNLMVAVATGGPRIQAVDGRYRTLRVEAQKLLESLGVEDPNPYSSLWDWYGKWSSGDLPSYQSRRDYLAAMYEPTLRAIRQRQTAAMPEVVATGWEEVDRRLRNLGRDLERASDPEHFQQVAYGCRGLYIALADAVHDPQLHPPADAQQTVKSTTDAKGRLADYFAAELADESSTVRDYAKAVVKFADAAGHNQTTTRRVATICFQAAVTLVNLVAVIDGRFDPKAH